MQTSSYWSPSTQGGSPVLDHRTAHHPALHALSPKDAVLAGSPDDAILYGYLVPLIETGRQVRASTSMPALAHMPKVSAPVHKAPAMCATSSASSSSTAGRSMRRTTSSLSTFSASSFASGSTAPSSVADSVMSRKRPTRLNGALFGQHASASELHGAYVRRGSASTMSSLASPTSLVSPITLARRSPLITPLEPVFEPSTTEDDPRTVLLDIWAQVEAKDAQRRRRRAPAAIVSDCTAPIRVRTVSAPMTITRQARRVASWLGLRSKALATPTVEQLDDIREPRVRRMRSIEQILSDAVAAVV